MSFISSLKKKINGAGAAQKSPIQGRPAPGVYHYKREDDHGKVRIHLRIDEDGRGLLLVNASRVYHLTQPRRVWHFLTWKDTTKITP